MSDITHQATVSFDRVVCGIDRSPQSQVGLAQAIEVGAADARIRGAFVLESGEAFKGGIHAAQIAGDLERGAKKALTTAQTDFPRIDTVLVRGTPVAALMNVVHDEKADLLAVGAHGGSRLAGIVLGSVATAMAHHAPCSVLLARSQESGPFLGTILLATDGSPESLLATSAVGELAVRHDSKVVVVTVTADGRDDDGHAEMAGAALKRVGLTPTIEVRKGNPHDRIGESPMRSDASLIALGSRGVSGIKSLGSVSERVAHQAPCSVLIVRDPSHVKMADQLRSTYYLLEARPDVDPAIRAQHGKALHALITTHTLGKLAPRRSSDRA